MYSLKKYFSKKGNKLRDICKICDNKLRTERAKVEKENMSKSRLILTENEERAFTKKAEEFCMSKTDFLKLTIAKAESEVFIKIDPKCFDNFNAQIMGIARNINQIAHVCNTTRNVYQTDVENLRKELKKIRDWQAELEEEFKMLDSSIKYLHEIVNFDDI